MSCDVPRIVQGRSAERGKGKSLLRTCSTELSNCSSSDLSDPEYVHCTQLCHLVVTDTIAAFTYKAIRAEEQPSKIRQLSIVSSSDRPIKCRLFHCQ